MGCAASAPADDTPNPAPLEAVTTFKTGAVASEDTGRLTIVNKSTALLTGQYGVAVLKCAEASLPSRAL